MVSALQPPCQLHAPRLPAALPPASVRLLAGAALACRVVWGLQFCFLAATGLCYKAKQIHNYRASYLWAAAMGSWRDGCVPGSQTRAPGCPTPLSALAHWRTVLPQASLWSLAAVVTGLSSYIVYWFIYDYTKDGVKVRCAALALCHAGRALRSQASHSACHPPIHTRRHCRRGLQAQNLAAWNAALAGFCMVTLANCALIVGGDYL